MAHDSYPLRTVSRLTGLSPDIIRVWERRYGVVEPARGPRGARLYTADDVAHLRLLRHVVESGRAIGDVARLTAIELRRLADAQISSEDGAGGTETRDREPRVIAKALEAVKDFDLDNLERSLGDALVALGSMEFVRSLAGPLLHEVGTRWEKGRITIAEEHFVAGVLRNLLAGLLRSRPPSHQGAVLLATPPGERHELGILLAAIVIADARFRLFYLGTELPAQEVVRAAHRAAALAVGIGVVNGQNREQAVTCVRDIEEALPVETEIWLGGRDASAVAAALSKTRVLVIPDLQSVDSATRRVRLRAAEGNSGGQ